MDDLHLTGLPDVASRDVMSRERRGSDLRPAQGSGGKERQAGVKLGDGYLRRLLVVGANAVLRMARQRGIGGAWILALLERKKPKTAAVVLANKTARTATALMARGDIYKPAVWGIGAVGVRMASRDDEPAAAGDPQTSGQIASSALT